MVPICCHTDPQIVYMNGIIPTEPCVFEIQVHHARSFLPLYSILFYAIVNVASSLLTAIGVFVNGIFITDNTLMSCLLHVPLVRVLKGMRVSREDIPKSGIAG